MYRTSDGTWSKLWSCQIFWFFSGHIICCLICYNSVCKAAFRALLAITHLGTATKILRGELWSSFVAHFSARSRELPSWNTDPISNPTTLHPRISNMNEITLFRDSAVSSITSRALWHREGWKCSSLSFRQHIFHRRTPVFKVALFGLPLWSFHSPLDLYGGRSQGPSPNSWNLWICYVTWHRRTRVAERI